MLLQMDIENLVTIEKSSILFSTGLTVITGETGTGKSILLDAINLALGGRATSQLIRPGCERADITLCFDICNLADAKKWLKINELNTGSECILRRTINRDGKSRSYINNVPVPLAQLRMFSEYIIQIHGQHAQQSLLNTDKQIKLLDEFAGIQTDISNIQIIAREYKSIKQKIDTLANQKEKTQAEQDWLQFQLNEFQSFNLRADSFEKLEQTHRQLTNADALIKNAEQALIFLMAGEKNALDLLQKTLSTLEIMQQADPTVNQLTNVLSDAIIPLKEISNDLRNYSEKITVDSEQLTQIDTKISELFNLARKYKIAPTQLFEYQNNLISQLKQRNNSEIEIKALIEQLAATEKKYLILATHITLQRKIAAEKLTNTINKTLKPLGLEKAIFEIKFEINNTPFSASGQEKINFLISTNPGQPLQPLNNVASGGELSRIGLAIHAATAQKHSIPTLIFDEIDTGISGGTAEKVGKLLRQIGKNHQTLCITHAPQVAAQGHQHLVVKKYISNNSTNSEIETLNSLDRIEELARMLGGIEITKKTLDHAREMIDRAQTELVE